MNIYKDEQEFIKHMEKLISRVDMTGQESWMMITDVEMFKGYQRETPYLAGETFKRSGIKYLVLSDTTQIYEEPTEAPEIFRPIQDYRTYDTTSYIPCNWVQNEYLLKGAQRYDPVDGLLYWMKLDVMEMSTESPSVARAADPSTWGLV